MNFAALIPPVVLVSIVLIALSFGLKASWSDATSLLRHPRDLFRAFLSMNIVMLLFAIALAKLFPLEPAVKLALVLLALSPVPPFLPGKQLKAGGEGSYVFGLLVGMSLISILATPLLTTLAGRVFGLDARVPPAVIAQRLFLTVLGPLGAGILLRSWKPDLADRLAKMASTVGKVLLLVGMFFILIATWRPIVALIGNGTIVAIAAFTVVGLLVGHLLGGPKPENRTSLALATASRHPAVALAIANIIFPGEKVASAAVLLNLIVSAIVTIPYLKWCQRRHSSPEPSGTGWKHRPA